jgi:hypothetical protein
MITERQFASSFPDFWQELLPLLTPSCVHLLNAGHEEHLQDDNGVEIEAVEISKGTRDAAVISEFAYYLAKEAFQRSLSVNDVFDDKTICSVAQASALDLVNSYEGKNVLPNANLNAAELNEGLELALRYESFARLQGGAERCTFQVPIKGCGVLHACHADLVIGDDYLIEVKTVKRSLAGKDIRQLVIYLALNSVMSPHPWQHAGFFNPRRATFHRFRTHALIDLMSGGKSVVDVYTELLDFTCSSDVQLDSTF